MRILNMQMLAILAVTGFVAGPVSNAIADDTTPASQNGVKQVGHEYNGGGESYYCPPGSSDRYDGGGTYRNYSSREGMAFLRKGHKYHGQPWCPPSAQRIQRTPVQYQRYYSNQYMGQPGPTAAANYQQIYMPTDTTQLGFYYQSVPTWQPRAGMLPPAPDPSLYHTRNCNACRGRGCKHCRGYHAGGPVYYSTGDQGISQPQPEAAPEEQNATPPVPPAPSKLNQASYQK